MNVSASLWLGCGAEWARQASNVGLRLIDLSRNGPVGADVVRRQLDALRRSLRALPREGFSKVHVLRGVEAVAAARIVRERLLNDYRHESGPFDVIGDVHGCRAELELLLDRLDYTLVRDGEGRPVDAIPPLGRKAVFVGDLVDRGPDSPRVPQAG